MSRVAIVTGAAQGIGKAIAIRLAEDGFDVAINDIASKKDMIDSVVGEIRLFGRRSFAVPADVAVDGEVKDMVATVVKELGGLDVMVSNAGITKYQSLLETSAEDWDGMMAINARSMFLCYKYAAEIMVAQGRPGRLIGGCSLAGKKGAPMFGAYCASKFAVQGLTQSAACELGKHGITVNAYAPGPIDTPMVQSEMLPFLEDLTLTGKIGSPSDVANLVSYLASAQSHYITGQTLTVGLMKP